MFLVNKSFVFPGELDSPQEPLPLPWPGLEACTPQSDPWAVLGGTPGRTGAGEAQTRCSWVALRPCPPTHPAPRWSRRAPGESYDWAGLVSLVFIQELVFQVCRLLAEAQVGGARAFGKGGGCPSPQFEKGDVCSWLPAGGSGLWLGSDHLLYPVWSMVLHIPGMDALPCPGSEASAPPWGSFTCLRASLLATRDARELAGPLKPDRHGFKSQFRPPLCCVISGK